MPNSICPANLVSGFDKPSQSSVENFVNCAWSRERILVSCTGDCLRSGLDSSQKPFYHGFPSPLTFTSQQMADPPRLSLIGHQILGKLLVTLQGPMSPERALYCPEIKELRFGLTR